MATLLRAYMNYDARPTEQWTCNLEFSYDGALDSGIVEDLSVAMASGLAGMLLTNVIIDRIVASTWVSDSAPYNPENVRVFPIGINGEREFLLTDPVDDDLVLFIRKAVSFGRAGKILLRGCLVTADLLVSAGSWLLDTGAIDDLTDAVSTLYDTLKTVAADLALVGSPLLSITYPATAEGVKQIPIKNYAETPTIRPVTSMVLVGVNERQDTQ